MAEDHEALVKAESIDFFDDQIHINEDSDDSRTEEYRPFDTYNDDDITYTESLEVDIIYSAPPLQELYRYHVYFSHSVDDQQWVTSIIQRLECEPYSYKCYYGEYSNGNSSLLQTSLCAAMLSERAVVVLSPNYVKSKWPEFQQTLQNMTESSLYRQRMLVILLKDCVVPESLQHLGFLDARENDFFPCFVRHLRSDRLPRTSESFSSDITCMLYKPTNMENGQLLTSLQFCIQGHWSASLMCKNEDDVPTPLCCHGIRLSYGQYAGIVQRFADITEDKKTFAFLFSIRPTLILIVIVVLWLSIFIFVLVFLMDEPNESALGIRLTVFSSPLCFVVYGYAVRWRRQRYRQKIGRQMLSECVSINQNLYEMDLPVLVTTTMTTSGIFHIHFVYFCVSKCVNDVDLMLNSYMDDDMDRFATLIEIYTGTRDYLIQSLLAERLTAMAAAVYLHRFLMRELPNSSQERHTSHKFCLCQFIETFISEFYQCLTKTAIVHYLEDFFESSLSCHVQINTLQRAVPHLMITEDLSFTST